MQKRKIPGGSASQNKQQNGSLMSEYNDFSSIVDQKLEKFKQQYSFRSQMVRRCLPQIEQESDNDSDLNLSDYEIDESDHYVPKVPKQHNSNHNIFEA